MSRAGAAATVVLLLLLVLGGYVWVSCVAPAAPSMMGQQAAAATLTLAPARPAAFPTTTATPTTRAAISPPRTVAAGPSSMSSSPPAVPPPTVGTVMSVPEVSGATTSAPPSPRRAPREAHEGRGEPVATGPCSSRIEPGPGAFVESDTRLVPLFTQTPLVTFADDASPPLRPLQQQQQQQPRFAFSRHCTTLGAKSKYRVSLQHIVVPPAISADVRAGLCGGGNVAEQQPPQRLQHTEKKRRVMLVMTCSGAQADHSYYAVHILWSVFFQLEAMGAYTNDTTATTAPTNNPARLRPDVAVSLAVVFQGATEPPDPHATLLVRMLQALVDERADSAESRDGDAAHNKNATGPRAESSVLVAFHPSKLGGEVTIPAVASDSSSSSSNSSIARRRRTVCADEIHMGWQAVFIRGGKQYFSLTLPRISRFQSRLHRWAGVGAPAPARGGAVNVFIIQRRGLRRRMTGLPTLIDALRGLSAGTDRVVNVTTVFLESSTVADQVRWFAEADVLVAVHGAAMSSMVMMRPGGLVVELGPAGSMRDIQRYFAPGVNVTGSMYGHLAVVQCQLHHVAVAVADLNVAEALKRAPPDQQGVSRYWKWADFPVASAATVAAVTEGVGAWMSLMLPTSRRASAP